MRPLFSAVKDNGIGMSKDFLAHVFDSFSREQTATRSGIQGTGLGMAITKNIVDMMGGTIAVKSEQGKGSEFTVTLDCKVCTESVKYPPIPGLKGTRALVVDDDAQTCMSVSKMLREIEMEADWTTSGKEAILRAREAHNQGAEFKVYIIDWLMPDMNGIETVRRIRKVIEPGTPIIILTAYDWADIEDEARQAGVTAFVSKPLFMSELRDALTHKVVSGRQPLLPKHGDYTGKKVLLVEDNELNREIAIAILEEAGLKVDAVEDGTDAVAKMNEAAEDEYDLILMDIQMPKMDGYTATREIRTLSSNKKANIPIVAMTANAFEEDRQKAFKAGMNAHIAKPIDVNILMGTLDKVSNRIRDRVSIAYKGSVRQSKKHIQLRLWRTASRRFATRCCICFFHWFLRAIPQREPCKPGCKRIVSDGHCGYAQSVSRPAPPCGGCSARLPA